MTHESRETSAEPGPGHAPSLPCRMPAQCSASLRLFPAVNRTGTLPGRAAGTKRLLLGARELRLQSRFCQVVAMQLYRGANPSEHRYPDVKNGANTGQRGRLKRWEGLQETKKEPPSSIKGHGVLRQGCLSDPFVRSLCRGWWLSSFNSRQAAFDHPSH